MKIKVGMIEIRYKIAMPHGISSTLFPKSDNVNDSKNFSAFLESVSQMKLRFCSALISPSKDIFRKYL